MLPPPGPDCIPLQGRPPQIVCQNYFQKFKFSYPTTWSKFLSSPSYQFCFDWRIPLISGVAAAGDGRGGLRERLPGAAGLQPLHVDRGRREGCERGHQDRVHVQLIRERRLSTTYSAWPNSVFLESARLILFSDHYVSLEVGRTL